MGQVVGGFAASHLLMSPEGVEPQAERILQGFLEIRRRIHALRPDILVLAGSDHLNNFTLATQVTIAVGIADEYTTWGDGGAPIASFAGHRAFGEDFARHARRSDVDLVQLEEVRPDHGIAVPKLAIDPRGEIPTVPVYINTLMPVPPSPRQSYRLGGILKDMVETVRPAGERAVVVGLGGMSHWLCVPEQGQIATAFDLDFIEQMISGRSEALAQIETEDLLAASGNGGLELGAWLFMAGALPKARGEKLFYEPVPQWITGIGGLALTPEAGSTDS